MTSRLTSLRPGGILRSKWGEHRALAVLIIVFLLVGVIYSIATPIFEAGDEVWHYPFVQYLATGHGLPVQDPAQKGLWEQEGGQPPLYYALSAAATFWVDTRDMADRLWRNPYGHIGRPLDFGNKNLVVHTSAEDFPWHNTTLAVHLIRFLSLLLGACTVAFTYLLTRELSAGSQSGPPVQETPSPAALASPARLPAITCALPLLAAALVAFNPMFLFISASVNNDNLATALAALALWLIVRLATRGPSSRRLFAVGIVVGLGALTKVSDLALLPLAGLVVAWLAWRGRDLRLLVRGAILLGAPPLLIAGWWYARNYLLYGDPLAFNVWVLISGGRAPVTLLGLLDEFQGFRISFWGNFGGVNLIAPEWVYQVLDLISLAALAGLGAAALRAIPFPGRRLSRTVSAPESRLPFALWIPALWLALILVSLIRWTLLTYASQGRLIFPALSAVAVLLAFGLVAFAQYTSGIAYQVLHKLRPHMSAKPRDTLWGYVLTYVPALFLLIFALAAPFFIIAPAYTLPPRQSADAEAPNPVHITYQADGAQPELVGYESGGSARPGGELPLTLYWRTGKPVNDDLYVYIHLYDASGKMVGQWDAFAGNGLYPTRLWETNEMIVDRYHVPVSIEATGPQLARVEVGLARVGSTRPLIAHDPEGNEITPTITRFKIPPAPVASGKQPALFKLGSTFQVVDAHIFGARGGRRFELNPGTPLFGGDTLLVSFDLYAVTTPAQEYKVFVHLVDPQGNIAAQVDDHPHGGAYPTLFWEAGEQVANEFELKIPDTAPAGDYRVEFGLYHPQDGTRLPVSGEPVGNLRAAGDLLLYAPLPVGK